MCAVCCCVDREFAVFDEKRTPKVQYSCVFGVCVCVLFQLLFLLPSTSGMRASLLLFCLLLTAFSVFVKGKPRGKQHAISKFSSSSKEKDMVIPEEANEAQVLPTLVTIEAGRQDEEDEEMSSLGSISSNKEEEELEETEQSERSIPVLLSEEELVDLLKEESKEKEREEGELESEEAVAQIREEEDKETEETEEDKVMRAVKEMNEEEVEKEVEEEEVEDMSSVAGTDKKEDVSVSVAGGGEQESDGSTESEIPVNLGLVGDSEMLQPLQTDLVGLKPPNVDSKLLSKGEMEVVNIKEEKKLVSDEEMTTITGYVEFDMQNTEALESEEVPDQEQLPEGSRDQNKGAQDKSQEQINIEKDSEVEAKLQVSKNSVELGLVQLDGKGDEEVDVEKSASITKGKSRKQKKKHRVRKHPPQRDEVHPAEGHHNREEAAQKPKRRRAGKWAPSVGMNPVQIRATVDLYPSARPFQGAGFDGPEATGDPCEYFHCKRGKACKLNEDKKPFCVCQEPTECPQSANEHDHVCGTDNTTYDTSCELFATKCDLEGTKRGHKLQLDYTGSCKFIAQCLNTELIQFPLRMRDWLKNVLLQLYEQDSMSPGFLTPKQRLRVKKISESERRLRAGDHPIELLVQDFEKNYNMYIYPVHWQFAQMDQHPSDRFLSHSELAPLRVPLVPMEHCTSRFFQECDADKDKQVSFREWAHCFGIKDEDMDVNLLF